VVENIVCDQVHSMNYQVHSRAGGTAFTSEDQPYAALSLVKTDFIDIYIHILFIEIII